MGKSIRKRPSPQGEGGGSLGELIHTTIRRVIELATVEQLEATLGAAPYQRVAGRRGYRNGWKTRTLTGPTGPLALTLPRATLFGPTGRREWTTPLLPRYERRVREVNEAVIATYLAGGNLRRLRGALAPLLKTAPLSKSAVSRVVATLKAELDAWATRPLGELDVVYAYLDAMGLPVRTGGKVVRVPVLAVVGVLADGAKRLLALELCAGGESYEAWKHVLDDLGTRGLKAPVLCIIDGHPGLRRALERVWPTAAVQRCCVHKLRNLELKTPKHARAEIRDDFHRIVYAESGAAARAAVTAFERAWAKRCPGTVRSLQEGGAELLTFFGFPRAQWKTLRTTNVIERLNEEFRRRVKTQGALPTEAAALVLLFALVASGQITLRRLDGWRQLAAVLRQRMRPAA
jgi:transposase-like protein